MMRRAAFRNLSSWLASVAVALAAPAAAFAQCAMCKGAAENMDTAGIKYLNIATLLLLTPPVAIFCGFFYLAYKRRDSPHEPLGETEQRRAFTDRTRLTSDLKHDRQTTDC